jgi:hypothetical protein
MPTESAHSAVHGTLPLDEAPPPALALLHRGKVGERILQSV